MCTPNERLDLAVVTQKLVGLSGKVVLVRENLLRLSARGWKPRVIAQRIDASSLAPGSATIQRVLRPPLGRRAQLSWFARRARALTRRSQLVVCHGESLLDPDVIHVHNCHHRQHEETYGRPLPASSVLGSAQERVLGARQFGVLIANSHLARTELVQRFDLPPERVDVVYPGVDRTRFRPVQPDRVSQTRRDLGLPPAACERGARVVGLVTSGDFANRAVDVFLRALARLPQSTRSGLHALVVGKERNLASYRALADECGVAGVHFRPPRPDVESFYAALDLLVHPAHWETFGMAVLEAMACRLAVITSARVGAAELFGAPARKWLLEAIDADELAGKIERLIADDPQRDTLAGQAFAATKGLDWDANVAGHVACYRRALEARASVGATVQHPR